MTVAVMRALALIKVAVETLKKLLGKTRNWDAFSVCPMKEMFRRSDVPTGGYLGVASFA
ncbi:MAG: hypothetical protein H8E62_08835 [Planctomycetes bacterium]|nr:hypothetical protein [Planctomycetota bacterium]